MLSRLYANVHFAMQSQTCIVTAADVHFAMCCHERMQRYTLRCSRRHVLSRLQTCILRRVVTTACRRALCDAAADMCYHDCFLQCSHRHVVTATDLHFAKRPQTCFTAVFRRTLCDAASDAESNFAATISTASQLNKNCLSFSSRITVKKKGS